MTNEEAAYIAGFFDGEGCVGVRFRNDSASITLTITQKRRGILDWIAEVLEYGKVTPHNAGTSWRLRITGASNVLRFSHEVGPFCKVKDQELVLAGQLCDLIIPGSTRQVPQKVAEARMMLGEEIRILRTGYQDE